MKKGLITANTWFGITFEDFRRVHLARLRRRFRIPDTGFDENSFPVKAFVNKGNWLVLCPKCGGAEYAWEELWYFCCSCKNSYMGHKFRRLVFPKERARIEERLTARPLENRNWTPVETVDMLTTENDEHAAELLPAGRG